jgi:tetratricopeptide (TPR) repeat protein
VIVAALAGVALVRAKRAPAVPAALEAPAAAAASPVEAPAPVEPPAPAAIPDAAIAEPAVVPASRPDEEAAPPTQAAPPAAEAPSPATRRNADYRRLLGAAERKYEAGRFLDAIADYRRALALRVTGPAHVGLARALYDANRSGEALGELERTIQHDGSYAPAWLLLGEIHQAEGRSRQARAAYERFLQLEATGERAEAVRGILTTQL